ncbi:MAG TPA: hypothetical protein VG457_11380 [Planctomycetota bacterium]|jgi:hypothetical protein|nr:hypothetical protein [Planctomycetota bacterium]
MKSLLLCLILLLSACARSDRQASRSSDPRPSPRILDGEYGRPAAEVWQAALAALEALELRIDDDRHDQLGGTLAARRGTGDRLTVEITAIDERRSRVVVRADPGLGPLASTIQGTLAEKLGLAKARTSFFRGVSAEGKYSCTLSRGASAAQRAVENLELDLRSIDVRQDVATVDACDEASVPVRIQLTRIDNETSKAVFTAGTRSHPARTTARRLKLEFERELLPPVEQ